METWELSGEEQRVTQAVEAQGLVKTYSGRSGTVEAVRGVDLRVET